MPKKQKPRARAGLFWLVLLFAPVASAQVFSFGAGSSTLYGNSGATSTVYLPSQTLTLSAGENQGTFRFSLADSLRWHGFDVTIGDRQFFFLEGNTGLGISERGVSIGREDKSGNTRINLFAGESGTLYSSPFFSGFGPGSFGTGIFLAKIFPHARLSTLEAIQGSKRTALQSLTADWRGLRFTGAVGWLQGERQFDAQGEYHARHFALLAAHNVYRANQAGITILVPESYSVDMLNASAGASRFDGSLSAFRASQGWTASATAGVRFGWLAVRESWAQGIALTTGAATWRHWTASGSWDGRTFAAGGSYHSNRIAASIGQSILFNVVTGRYQSATLASLTVNVRNGSGNLAGLVRPGNKMLYTVAARDYEGQPLNEARAVAVGGNYVVAGTVRDAEGQPVAGAALSIGGQEVYTDSDGNFQARFKKPRPVPCLVLVQNFVTGTWLVLAAPSMATPGQPLAVVVRRQ